MLSPARCGWYESVGVLLLISYWAALVGFRGWLNERSVGCIGSRSRSTPVRSMSDTATQTGLSHRSRPLSTSTCGGLVSFGGGPLPMSACKSGTSPSCSGLSVKPPATTGDDPFAAAFERNGDAVDDTGSAPAFSSAEPRFDAILGRSGVAVTEAVASAGGIDRALGSERMSGKVWLRVRAAGLPASFGVFVDAVKEGKRDDLPEGPVDPRFTPKPLFPTEADRLDSAIGGRGASTKNWYARSLGRVLSDTLA